jgi:hypothetical protein
MNRALRLLFAAALLTLLPALAASSGSCFKLDGQSYCHAWSAKDATSTKTEFLRSGETVDRWQNMVTILSYGDVHTLAGATGRYMAIVKPYLGPGANPQWVTPKKPLHAGEAATRLLLSSGSDTEYVVVYFAADPGKPAYVVAFSQHVPLPSGQTPTLAQYGHWVNDMRAMVPRGVAQ